MAKVKVLEWPIVKQVFDALDNAISKKFWVALLLMVIPLVLVKVEMTLPEDVVKYVYITGWVYICAEGLADLVSRFRK